MMNKIFKYMCGCVALCGMAAAMGSCSDDNDPTYLDELKVSSSYVAIPQDGGTATITLNASADWQFTNQQWIQGKDTIQAATPHWLTVSNVSGSAGESQLTFSADGALDGRSCELLISR